MTDVPDLTCRLAGKRVTGGQFNTCLLATEMETTTPDGFGAIDREQPLRRSPCTHRLGAPALHGTRIPSAAS